MTKKFEQTEAFFKKGKVKVVGGRGDFAKVVKAYADRNRNNLTFRKLPMRGRGDR